MAPPAVDHGCKPASSVASRAVGLNELIMHNLEEALEEDPEIDLFSVISPSYRIRLAESKQQSEQHPNGSSVSAAAKLNYRTLGELGHMIIRDPEVDLYAQFPKGYCDKKHAAEHSGAAKTISETVEVRLKGPPHFLTRIEDNVTATIISPLSNTVVDVLREHWGITVDCAKPSTSFQLPLKQALIHSEKLWEGHGRGAVFKCGKDIVVKVVHGLADLTEYKTLQYLAENAPDIPAPKPHGLLNLPEWKVIFMSYVPSMTLAQAWPTLDHDQKSSIQHQLEDILCRLRSLRHPDGHPLGGVGGEGVKDHRREQYRSDKVINTGAEFEDFQFSIPHGGSESYIRFLRSFLPPPMQSSVFTHGDFRQDNIMVVINANEDSVMISGIIDWEDSGFYPDYHESMKATNNMTAAEEDDWYQFLPPCIAPTSYGLRWLVDRLWDRFVYHSL